LYRSLCGGRTSKFLDSFGNTLNRTGLKYATGLTRAKATLFSSTNPIEVLLAWDFLTTHPYGNRSRLVQDAARKLYESNAEYAPILEEIKRIEKLEETVGRIERGEMAAKDFSAFVWPFFCGEHLAPYRLIERAYKAYYRDNTGIYSTTLPYQIYSLEYVAAIGQKIKSLNVDGPIIEICAGKGLLTRQLRTLGINIIATDRNGGPGVEALDHKAALEKYRPALVVGAWIPQYTDFAAGRHYWSQFIKRLDALQDPRPGESLMSPVELADLIGKAKEFARTKLALLDQEEPVQFWRSKDRIDVDVLTFPTVRYLFFIGAQDCGSEDALAQFPFQNVPLEHALNRGAYVNPATGELEYPKEPRIILFENTHNLDPAPIFLKPAAALS
jgi:hypothetical protein